MKKIGIVGVGCISGIYLKNITNLYQNIEVIGVCDLIRERAENAVKEYNEKYGLTVDKYLNNAKMY